MFRAASDATARDEHGLPDREVLFTCALKAGEGGEHGLLKVPASRESPVSSLARIPATWKFCELWVARAYDRLIESLEHVDAFDVLVISDNRAWRVSSASFGMHKAEDLADSVAQRVKAVTRPLKHLSCI
eukprot:4709996-Prymnesium_polylepis.1